VPPVRSLRLAPEWDPRYTRMLALSAAVHVVAVAAMILVAPYVGSRPLPLVAYTVEITDPNALGGRLPRGPINGNVGGATTQPLPEPKGQPEAAKPAEASPPVPPEPKPAEPKPPEPVAKTEPAVEIPEKMPEVKPEPKPEVKPEPKPEVKPEPKPEHKPEVKPEPKPVPKPEPPKAQPKPTESKPAEAKPAAKAETKPADSKTAQKPSANGANAGSPTGQQDAPARDAYAAAAERWKTRAGGGLGGNDTGSGPIGTGGDGKGGGGQLVALEFIAYRQQVINTIKGEWTNVLGHAGLVAKVRFQIAPDGSVSDIRLEQGSGNAAYDASALRAVQHVTLPPPPARYASDFRDFVMEFHSEEAGGQGEG
jgi:TonB family protein